MVQKRLGFFRVFFVAAIFSLIFCTVVFSLAQAKKQGLDSLLPEVAPEVIDAVSENSTARVIVTLRDLDSLDKIQSLKNEVKSSGINDESKSKLDKLAEQSELFSQRSLKIEKSNKETYWEIEYERSQANPSLDKIKILQNTAKQREADLRADEIKHHQDIVLEGLNTKKLDKKEFNNLAGISSSKEEIAQARSEDADFDFGILYQYKTINAFAGIITKQGLEKLSNNFLVERIEPDVDVQMFLSQSVPLINATPVWSLQFNGSNLTGEGQTICIVDTGIDYTHNDLGDCSAPVAGTLTGNNVSYYNESDHDYSNSAAELWTITQPEFSSIAVHFSNFSTEANYDLVYIRNASNHTVATFSGALGNFWSPSVVGDTIAVYFEADSSVTGFGYIIDAVQNGTTNNDYSWSCDKVIGGYDMVNSDADPIDDEDHGTHVAGIAAANGTVIGVAPGARLVAMKVLNSGGSGTSQDIVAGIDWCNYHAATLNISVISMSLGSSTRYTGYCDSVAMAQAANSAASNGIFVSVASGNAASSTSISAPACASNVTAVASVYDANVGSVAWSACTDSSTAADQMVCHANRGGSHEVLLAPGAQIYSTIKSEGYDTYGGTSMATPHVSGAVAILFQFWQLENSTSLNPFEVRRAFNQTGFTVFDSNTSRNYSRIDVLKAIRYFMLSQDPDTNSLSNKMGNVTFLSSTSLENATACLTIADNLVAMSSDNCPELNISANVTINGLSYSSTPNILRDNELCPSDICSALSYSSSDGIIVFNVTGFSNYSTNVSDAPNTPPTTTNPTTSHDTDVIYENSTVYCYNSTSSDDENDTITFNYTWFINESSVVVTSQTINGSDLSHFDNITCEIRACDSSNCSIGYNSSVLLVNNSLPEALSVSLSPSTVYKSTTELNCSASYYDADNDAETGSTYKWFNSSDEIAGAASSTLSSSNYFKEYNITCEYAPNDGYDANTAVNSSQVSILNSLPVAGQPTLDPLSANKTTESIICVNNTFTDDDNDTSNWSVKWYVNGILEGTATDNLTNASFNRSYSVICETIPFDGSENGTAVNSSALTVDNLIPPGPTALTPITGIYGNLNDTINITCSGSTDDDLDTIYYNLFVLYENDSLELIAENITDNYDWNISRIDTQENILLLCNATDLLGTSISYNASANLSVDNSWPELSVASPINSTFYSTANISVGFSANDPVINNLDKCWFVDASEAVVELPNCANTTFIAPESFNNITVYANDSVNHINSTQVFFTSDITPPELNITQPENSTYYNSENISIGFDASDTNLNSCWLANSTNEIIAVTDCLNTTILEADGERNLTFYVNDSAGNVNSTQLFFFVDTAYPSLELASPVNGSYYNETNISLGYSASDANLGSCWLTNLSGDTEVLDTCQNMTFLANDGYYNITVYVNDSAQNTNSTTIFFTIDTAVPEEPSSQGQTPVNNSFVNQSYYEINFSFTDNNPNNCWVINSSEELIYMDLVSELESYYCNLTVPADDGAHNYTVYVNDSTGNINSSGTFFVNIDTALPGLNVSYPENSSYYNLTELDLNFSVSDANLDSCWADILGISTDLGCENTTVLITFLPNGTTDGDYNVTVYVNDSANNINSSQIFFTIQTNEPAISSIASGSVTSSSATITWTTDDLSNSTVYYGTSTDVGSASLDSSLVTSHSISLSSLSASTAYYYNVSSCNAVYYCNVSEQYSFTTSAQSNSPGGSGGGGGGGGGGAVTNQMNYIWPSLSSGKTYFEPNKDTIPITNVTLYVVAALPIRNAQIEIKAGITDTEINEKAKQINETDSSILNINQYVQINIYEITAAQISSVQLEFRILKAWFKTRSADKNNVFLFRFDSTLKQWAQLPTALVREGTDYIYYSADSSGFSYFAIAEKTPEKAKVIMQEESVLPGASPEQENLTDEQVNETKNLNLTQETGEEQGQSRIDWNDWNKTWLTPVIAIACIVIIIMLGARIYFFYWLPKKKVKEIRQIKQFEQKFGLDKLIHERRKEKKHQDHKQERRPKHSREHHKRK